MFDVAYRMSCPDARRFYADAACRIAEAFRVGTYIDYISKLTTLLADWDRERIGGRAEAAYKFSLCLTRVKTVVFCTWWVQLLFVCCTNKGLHGRVDQGSLFVRGTGTEGGTGANRTTSRDRRGHVLRLARRGSNTTYETTR